MTDNALVERVSDGFATATLTSHAAAHVSGTAVKRDDDQASVATAEWPLGATLVNGSCQFRVWAPQAITVVVQLEPSGRKFELKKDTAGYFNGSFAEVKAGDRYRYVVDDKAPLPDPCSRYQPDGPHEASLIVDRDAYVWSDANWQGITLAGQVLYELHIGTFTAEGNFDAAIEKFPHLKTLGITCIEVMPLAEWAGNRNWGYDGVSMFAPTHCYGDYNAFKRFVDAAHAQGLAVILDVVYNHLGPDGNYLSQFSSHYFSDRHTTDWGPPLNFDGEQCAAVRHYIISNACEWIHEFHLDGLRFDATQSIHDDSELHILAELNTRVRQVASPRSVILISENEPQNASHLLSVDRGGLGFDGMWNDDFHHSAQVAATGRREAYYLDYSGQAQELVSAVKHGFLFQGQYYHWQKQLRGQPLQTALSSCITFLENHDQVANSLHGNRVWQFSSAARHRALVALLLLSPQTPMLFMGQEFNCTTPFLFFTDHVEPLSTDVAQGRKTFLGQFPSIANPEAQALIDNPGDERTFQRCKLNWDEVGAHRAALQLYTDLLALRRNDAVIAAQAAQGIDGAIFDLHSFVLRWFDAEQGDRLLLVNLGTQQPVQPRPEPLLAPPPGREWLMRWSSDAVDYGGMGVVNPLTETGWQLPGESAVFFTAEPAA